MKIAALLLAFLALQPAATSLHAADTLADIVASNDGEWMIGNWASEDGNLSISYTWKLDKHAIGVTFKMGDRESEGMIMVKPGTTDVVYASVDNKGSVTHGKWDAFHDHPGLFTTTTRADGTESKMVAEHIRTDDDTLTVNVYRVGDDGKPDESSSRSVVFKRKK